MILNHCYITSWWAIPLVVVGLVLSMDNNYKTMNNLTLVGQYDDDFEPLLYCQLVGNSIDGGVIKN